MHFVLFIEILFPASTIYIERVHGKKRFRIGFLTQASTDRFQSEMLSGVVDAAVKHDADIIRITLDVDYSFYRQDDRSHNRLEFGCRIADALCLDGLLHLGWTARTQRVKDLVKKSRVSRLSLGSARQPPGPICRRISTGYDHTRRHPCSDHVALGSVTHGAGRPGGIEGAIRSRSTMPCVRGPTIRGLPGQLNLQGPACPPDVKGSARARRYRTMPGWGPNGGRTLRAGIPWSGGAAGPAASSSQSWTHNQVGSIFRDLRYVDVNLVSLGPERPNRNSSDCDTGWTAGSLSSWEPGREAVTNGDYLLSLDRGGAEEARIPPEPQRACPGTPGMPAGPRLRPHRRISRRGLAAEACRHGPRVPPTPPGSVAGAT